MKKPILLLALVVAVSLIAGYLLHRAEQPKPAIAADVDLSIKLTHRQKAWLGALEWCESRGRSEAVNPKDRDNTPSYGLLQFKPSTYTYFAKRYALATTTDYMNPDGQEAIVEQMIIKGDVNWHQQFPDCVLKLGLPPKLST